MKSIWSSFKMLMKQIRSDGILVVVLIAPILAGFFFKFGIPFIDLQISIYYDINLPIYPFYRLIDLVLGAVTSYMFAFVIAMSMLEDYDNNIIAHLIVTPIKRSGYLISRIVIPLGISWAFSVIVMQIFTLEYWPFQQILLLTGLLTISSFSISLMIFCFSNNKVEGMAIAKISGITMMGLVIPFVLSDNTQFLFGFLPSFWIAKLAMQTQFFALIFTLICTAFWIFILYKKFLRKLSK